jgi:hypothetical protein
VPINKSIQDPVEFKKIVEEYIKDPGSHPVCDADYIDLLENALWSVHISLVVLFPLKLETRSLISPVLQITGEAVDVMTARGL